MHGEGAQRQPGALRLREAKPQTGEATDKVGLSD